MAEAALVLRGEGATVYGKANWSAGEHQGAWGKLTEAVVIEEGRCAGLSTCEVFGAVKKLAGARDRGAEARGRLKMGLWMAVGACGGRDWRTAKGTV